MEFPIYSLCFITIIIIIIVIIMSLNLIYYLRIGEIVKWKHQEKENRVHTKKEIEMKYGEKEKNISKEEEKNGTNDKSDCKQKRDAHYSYENERETNRKADSQ